MFILVGLETSQTVVLFHISIVVDNKTIYIYGTS